MGDGVQLAQLIPSSPNPHPHFLSFVLLFCFVLSIIAILTGVRSMCVTSQLLKISSKDLMSVQCLQLTRLYTETFVGRLSQIQCSPHTHTQKGGQEEAFAGEAMFHTL